LHHGRNDQHQPMPEGSFTVSSTRRPLTETSTKPYRSPPPLAACLHRPQAMARAARLKASSRPIKAAD
jgi:hypothetical protein